MRTIAIALGAAIMASTSAAADYLVKEVGSFHVGGHTETLNGLPSKEIVFSPGAPAIKVDPNGEFEVEQMYVQFVKQAAPKSKLPLLLWHGGGLSGATWETKPDGKPGWQQFFLNAGYDVYVSDAVERGRASWARYPEIFKSEPFFRPKKEAWELFRIGPSYEVGGNARRSKASNSRSRRSISSPSRAFRAGRPMTLLLRGPMTRWCRKYARALSWCTARAAISASRPRSMRPTR